MEIATLSSILGAAALATNTAMNIVQNKQNTKAAEAAAKVTSSRLATQAANQEEERKNLLRKQLAANIARLSAAGLEASDTGSNEAVLKGITNDAKEDITQIRSGYLLDMQELKNSLAQTQRKNLLSSASALSQGIGKTTNF